MSVRSLSSIQGGAIAGSERISLPSTILVAIRDTALRQTIARQCADPSVLHHLFPNTLARIIQTDEPELVHEWIGSARPEVVILEMTASATECAERMRGLVPDALLLLLTRDGGADIIEALDAGADDAVSLATSADECVARVRVRWSRRRPSVRAKDASRAVVYFGDIAADPATGHAARRGVPIALTPTECSIVQLLLTAEGGLVSHEQLVARLWPNQQGDGREQLRVHLAAIRRKLEPDPAHPRYIITVPRVGYRFVPDTAT